MIPSLQQIRKSFRRSSLGRFGAVSLRIILISAFLLLVIGIPFAHSESSPKLSFELVEWPHQYVELPRSADDEGAAMLLGMMEVGGIEMQVRLIAALNYLDTPDAVDSLSLYSKNLVDTLMKRGFDREHAIRILTVIGMPQIPSN